MKDFNGFSFDDCKTRKRMRYLVVTKGDLDVNNAYAFSSKASLKKYLKSDTWREVYAVFEVKEFTEWEHH